MELHETDTLTITTKGAILHRICKRVSMPPINTVLQLISTEAQTWDSIKKCGIEGIEKLVASLASKNYITVTHK